MKKEITSGEGVYVATGKPYKFVLITWSHGRGDNKIFVYYTDRLSMRGPMFSRGDLDIEPLLKQVKQDVDMLIQEAQKKGSDCVYFPIYVDRGNYR